jgi:glycoprotein endo-alpha-1,2-mannosidase
MRHNIAWTLVLVILTAIAGMGANAQTNAFTVTPASDLHPHHQVLAFYYTWYGPQRHWGKVDAANHDIEASRHYPEQGPYDSHDPAVISGQIAKARNCGITGFICTWWGRGTYEDQAVPLVLKAAQGKHFNVTVYWEAAPGKGQAQIDNAVGDLVYIVSHYSPSSAFLKVDGKPVIFVYGRVMDQVPFSEWPEIINRAHAEAGDFLLICDGYAPRNTAIFDGLHTYNICGQVKGKTPDELRAWSAEHYGRAVKIARSHGRISCVDVIPGYDDTKVRHPGLAVDRLDGQVYRVLWEQAIKADPDWVLITTWNEWHEGSEIEPSYEFGNKYLKLTRDYATRFSKGD